MYTMVSSHRKVWSNYAACTEYPKLFGDDMRTTAKAAIGICNTCPVKELCLEWAISNEVEGVFGGTTTSQRKEMRKDRQALEAIREKCPPEPKLLDYVNDPPAVVQKPKTVKMNPATHNLIQKPASVGHGTRVSKRKTPEAPQSLMALVDQLLLGQPASS